jgi:DNA modification methylase
MHEFKDGTIPLIVVSPSYGVGMEYEEGVSFEQHIADLKRCVPEWGRKLMKGGYLCINFGDIHNFGTKNGTEPEIQLMGHFFQDSLRPLNIRLRDIIVWDKGFPWTTNRQVIPYIDTPHTEYRLLNSFEHIYIFKKDGKRGLPLDVALKSKVIEDEWKECVPAVWKIRPVPSQKGHPAQFPEELPRRLIKMFSCEGDIVVDTALGSGTTIKVARELKRKGFGYERDLRYKPVIMKKLGISEGDVKKPNAKQKPEGSDARQAGISEGLKMLEELIAKEDRTRSELVSATIPLNPTTSTKDISVVWAQDLRDPEPLTADAPSLVAKADDYDGKNADLAEAPSTLAKAA